MGKRIDHIKTIGIRLVLGFLVPVALALTTSSFWLLPVQPSPAADFADAEENETNFKFKSLYCWKFIKYIEWPSSYHQGSFEIGVLGDSPIQKYFEEWQVGRKVNLQDIVVKKYSSASSVDKPHILYIPSSRSKDISSALKNLQGKSTLVITEKDGLANQGSMINFIVVNSRVRFEINKGNAEKFDLLVSSSLLELSTRVYE